MNHDVNTLKQIIINNNAKNKDLWQALTYKLIKQRTKHNKNKYVVSISFEKHLIKKIYKGKNNGCIGVDINQDHLAVSNLDNKGNLLNIDTFNYDLNGTKHQNNNSISLAVKDLMLVAVKLNKPIVIEQLDFSAKKKSLKSSKNQYIKNRNKQLSSFAYSKIIELIKARAEDNFIEVREINPAYTSIIGSIKYSNRSRIDVHHGAAVCIGRKGLFGSGYKEKRISSKNRQIKSINLPERNNLNSVVYWKELKENMMKNKQHEKKSRCKVINSDITAKYSTSLGHSDVPVMNFNVGTLL
jgi:IS605 OrfB family transposase